MSGVLHEFALTSYLHISLLKEQLRNHIVNGENKRFSMKMLHEIHIEEGGVENIIAAFFQTLYGVASIDTQRCLLRKQAGKELKEVVLQRKLALADEIVLREVARM